MMKRFEHGGNDILDYKNPYREIPEINKMTGVIIHETHDCEHNGFGHVNKYVISGGEGARGVEEGFKFLVLNSWGVPGFMDGLWEVSLFRADDDGFINPLSYVSRFDATAVRTWINRTIALLRKGDD